MKKADEEAIRRGVRNELDMERAVKYAAEKLGLRPIETSQHDTEKLRETHADRVKPKKPRSR